MPKDKAQQSARQPFPKGEGVLVTGSSSGIGHEVAEYLAERGFTVFASVRKEQDAERLRSLGQPNLVPVCPLDLTRLDHIPPVVEAITQELDHRGQNGLYAIVNNAGGGSQAPIELLDLAKFRSELEARILGPVALLQSFLPLIRAAHGRILWIATPALLPIPYVASIHACDFAVNCMARTLELELMPWRIPSISIRCGGIDTAAPGKTARELEAALQAWPRERLDLYARALQKEQEELSAFDRGRTNPREVAKVVFAALSARKPKRRYYIGHMAALAAFLELFPQPVVDWIMAKRA